MYACYVGAALYLIFAMLPLFISLCTEKLYPEQITGDTQLVLPSMVLTHTNTFVQIVFFGWLLGTLDRRATEKDATGELGSTFIFFLPAVALIQPNGSMVEMIGGATAALIAAYGWRWAWERWPKPVEYSRPVQLSRSLT